MGRIIVTSIVGVPSEDADVAFQGPGEYTVCIGDDCEVYEITDKPELVWVLERNPSYDSVEFVDESGFDISQPVEGSVKSASEGRVVDEFVTDSDTSLPYVPKLVKWLYDHMPQDSGNVYYGFEIDCYDRLGHYIKVGGYRDRSYVYFTSAINGYIRSSGDPEQYLIDYADGQGWWAGAYRIYEYSR